MTGEGFVSNERESKDVKLRVRDHGSYTGERSRESVSSGLRGKGATTVGLQ